MTGSIIVFGGSGFIGTHLIRRLVTLPGVRVVSVDIVPPREVHPGVDYRIHDVRSLADFEAPADTTTIYNFAAVHTTPGHEPWEYYETNVHGAVEVTRLARRFGVREIVFTSSISVYGPGEETKSEQTPLAPTSDYGRSKRMAEEIHDGWVDLDVGHRLVVVRPAVVFGAGERGNFTRMAKLLQKGFFVFPGRRDTIKACIYVEDLLDAIEFARARQEKKILFNGAFPQRYTIEQIVETLRAEHFPKARTYTVPRSVVVSVVNFLKLIGGAQFGFHPDRVEKLIRSTDISPKWLLDAGFPGDRTLSRALKLWSEETAGRFE